MFRRQRLNFRSLYNSEESIELIMYLCQTNRYCLATRESYQSIVLNKRFDWLVLID